MILYMHIALGQGLTTPWGRNFDINRNVLSLRSFVAKFKKNLFEVWFYTIFFMILYRYKTPGLGQTAPRGQSFDFNRNVLPLHSFVASFKKMSLKSAFMQFVHNLIHVYSPGAGVYGPQGTKFWCQQKGLITLPICCKFQRNLFEVWFYTFFSWFNSPGAVGHTAPRWQCFDVRSEEVQHTCTIHKHCTSLIVFHSQCNPPLLFSLQLCPVTRGSERQTRAHLYNSKTVHQTDCGSFPVSSAISTALLSLHVSKLNS